MNQKKRAEGTRYKKIGKPHSERPVPDLEDIEKRKKLERDVLNLLQTVRNRNDFIRELKKVIAGHGQQVGSEQFEAALRAFDEYWSQRGKP